MSLEKDKDPPVRTERDVIEVVGFRHGSGMHIDVPLEVLAASPAQVVNWMAENFPPGGKVVLRGHVHAPVAMRQAQAVVELWRRITAVEPLQQNTYSKEALKAWKQQVRKAYSVERLRRWTGLLPSPGLRKQVTKMLADQEAHLQELAAAGRHTAVKWQRFCTYGLWLWYVVKRLVTVGRTLKGRIGG